MVKNLPTIERSTKIRFGKYATEDQGENTVVFNASNVAIDTSGSGSIYMTPLRVTNPASTTVIGYNPTTKELYNTNVLTSDIGNGGGGDITLGTGTTGDYVSTITGGNGITTTGATSGETIAHTLSIDTKSNGGLVIESNKLAVNLGASSITGTLAVGDGGTGATTLDNLITLGSHTTGNYVQSITGGNGITAGAASEGGTPTVAIDAKTNGGLVIESNQLAVDLGASSITGTLAVGDGGTGATTLTSGKIPYIKDDNTFGDSKISYNTATEVTSLSSNLTVTGNLLVQGSATFQHSEIHSVSDPIIEVGNANAIDTIDMGMIMTRPTANVVAGFRGDEKEYTIAFTHSDPSSTDIVPTNASSDGYITANIWGNVLCGNVTTSGSLTSTAVNVDGITTSNVVLAGGYVSESTAQYFTVTAVVGAFIIDGVAQPALTLYRGVTYRFDYSDSSNASHPLRISTTAEGLQYNTGYSSFGTRGTAGAYIQFIVPMEAPDTMYYNCEVHPGMGNTINIISPSLTSSVSTVSSNVFIGNHIGIGTSSPSYPLDVTGNMNVTGGLRVNDSTGTSGQVLTSSGGGVMSWGSVGTAQGGTGVSTGLSQLDAGNITSGTLAVGRGGTGATTLDNLITLGSHTTGNYVQSITGGNGITAGAASEGGTPTVAIDAKTNGGLVIESNQLAVDLGASSITGTLAVGDGGTNITNYGTGEILYSSTGSLTKLPIGTAGEVLTVDGTGIPSWAAASAPSPWTTSSSDIYYNSGNVGIGTATPSSNLEVKVSSASSASNPIAKFTAATSSGGNDAYTQIEGYEDSALNFYGHYFGDGFTIGCQQNFNPGAGFTISHGNTLQSNPRFFINLSGNVGIGTTNPGSKLDVSGTVTASSFSGSGSGLTSMSASNISSGTLAVGRGGTGQSSYSTGDIIYATGSTSLTKLPIGTAGEVLTVDGTGIPSWAAASAPSPWTTSSSDIYYNSGNVGIGTATPSSNLEVKVSSASSASNPIAKFTAATSSGGNDAYTQIEGYEDSALNFYGHYFSDGFTIGYQQNFNPGAGFTISHGNTLQSNPRFFINLSGNVGIGTTNPGSKLDVSGTVTASSFSGSGSGLTSMSASNISSGTLAVGRGGTGQSSYSTGDIIYATGSTSLTKLPIGTAGEVLTVDGTGIPSWAAASGGGFTGDIAEYITHTSDSDTKFGFPQNDTFTITTANGERFRIDSNGDVGIGTTNPVYKLHVNGNGYFSSSLTASSFSGSGSGLTSLNAGNISSGTLAFGRGGTGQSSYSTGDILYSSGGSLNKLSIGSTGEVLTVSGGIPSWAAASGGGGGGGATAGTTSVSHFSNEITVSVSGGPYDYMYNETSYDVYSTSSTFNTINISTAMTHGQKLVLKLHTTAVGIQGKIALGSSLSVRINGTTHTVFSNFQGHTLHFPYDNNPTPSKFLILEITKEDTNQVTVEAKLSAADFTKTSEFDVDWNYNGITALNRDSAIHNVAYTSFAGFSSSQFQLRLGYLGVGHSHDFYFQQSNPAGFTVQASQIEFYYNNSSSSWSQASQTNVYTNFDKSVGMTLTDGKYYHIHHEVIQGSTDDYPSKILFTVEEMNAASGGGGGGGSYGTSEFGGSIVLQTSFFPFGIVINSSYTTATNYNYNASAYDLYTLGAAYYIDLQHTLPSGLPVEYEFYFYNYSGTIFSNFEVWISGIPKTTFNKFPGSGQTSMSCSSSSNFTYSLTIKSRDPTHNIWTAEWKEYRY